MELKKSFDFRKILIILYVVLFVGFLAYGLTPVEATAQYIVSGELKIPAIDLVSDVTELELEDNRLNTPDKVVGSFKKHKNKTLLIGHSSTVFENLENVKVGDIIIYNNHLYSAINARVVEKSEISMKDLLKEEARDTLVVMTCAGEDLGNGDATHRFMLIAKAL